MSRVRTFHKTTAGNWTLAELGGMVVPGSGTLDVSHLPDEEIGRALLEGLKDSLSPSSYLEVETAGGTTNLSTAVLAEKFFSKTNPLITDFDSAGHNHENADGAGQLDHGNALTGKGDDDHTQYADLAQNETVTGAWQFPSGANQPTIGGSKMTTESYVDNKFDSLNHGVSWQDEVINQLTTPPGSPNAGDRYIIKATATGVWAGKETQIAQWDGVALAWDYTIPQEGFCLYDDNLNKYLRFDGAAWVSMGGAVSHEALLDLLGGAANDHYHVTLVQHTALVGGANDAASLHHHDSQYFRETEFIATSTGGTDAGKPVKTNASGEIDKTLLGSLGMPMLLTFGKNGVINTNVYLEHNGVANSNSSPLLARDFRIMALTVRCSESVSGNDVSFSLREADGTSDLATVTLASATNDQEKMNVLGSPVDCAAGDGLRVYVNRGAGGTVKNPIVVAEIEYR